MNNTTPDQTLATLEDGGRRNGAHDPRRLLDKTDPRYLRRLVRELNGLPDGFYLSSGARYSRTRYSKGRFQVYIPLPGVRATWHDLAPGEHFRDAYGREVTASRTP